MRGPLRWASRCLRHCRGTGKKRHDRFASPSLRPLCAAINARAVAKLGSLAVDAAIIDLEDAVAPDDKAAAREALAGIFAARPSRARAVVRVNALSSPWGEADLEAAAACRADAILLPKVDGPRDVIEANDRLDERDADPAMALWAMIETPRGLLNLGGIAELGRDAGAGSPVSSPARTTSSRIRAWR